MLGNSNKITVQRSKKIVYCQLVPNKSYQNCKALLVLLRAAEFCGVNIKDKNLCTKHSEEVTEYNLEKN